MGQYTTVYQPPFDEFEVRRMELPGNAESIVSANQVCRWFLCAERSCFDKCHCQTGLSLSPTVTSGSCHTCGTLLCLPYVSVTLDMKMYMAIDSGLLTSPICSWLIALLGQMGCQLCAGIHSCSHGCICTAQGPTVMLVQQGSASAQAVCPETYPHAEAMTQLSRGNVFFLPSDTALQLTNTEADPALIWIAAVNSRLFEGARDPSAAPVEVAHDHAHAGEKRREPASQKADKALHKVAAVAG